MNREGPRVVVTRETTVRRALRRYWTERLSLPRWLFVYLWVNVLLDGLVGLARIAKYFR